jgi:hypothetical protein
MEELMNTHNSYLILLVVQALHLIHHRLTKRHISFVECVAALVLIYQPSWEMLPSMLVVTAHYALVTIQVIGSIFIRRLSPSWRNHTSGML